MPAPHHSVFYRPDAIPAVTNSVKALKARKHVRKISNICYIIDQLAVKGCCIWLNCSGFRWSDG